MSMSGILSGFRTRADPGMTHGDDNVHMLHKLQIATRLGDALLPGHIGVSMPDFEQSSNFFTFFLSEKSTMDKDRTETRQTRCLLTAKYIPRKQKKKSRM